MRERVTLLCCWVACALLPCFALVGCCDDGPATSTPVSTDARKLPPTPLGEDVAEHLAKFETGDETRLVEIKARLEGHVKRPWTVERLATEFAAGLDTERRADLVHLLGASRDPRGLRIAGNALEDREKYVRIQAARVLAWYWAGMPGQGGLEGIIPHVIDWWKRRRESGPK